MVSCESGLPVVTVDEVLRNLDELVERPRTAPLAPHSMGGPAWPAGCGRRLIVATDGDGTLWTGDIGEALFHATLSRGLVGSGARPALVAEARDHRVPFDAADDAKRIVERIWQAYLDRSFPEPRICEVMAWCMADMEASELAHLCKEVLEVDFGLRARWIGETIAVMQWAARRGIESYLISASPRAVVEAAAIILADDLSLPIPRVLAMTPALVDGRIAPRLAGVAPYGEGKRVALRAEAGPDAVVVAALGDNVFDAAMLLTARCPLAVRPKPALREVSDSVPGLVVLDELPEVPR